jgi:hypothetical protein
MPPLGTPTSARNGALDAFEACTEDGRLWPRDRCVAIRQLFRRYASGTDGVEEAHYGVQHRWPVVFGLEESSGRKDVKRLSVRCAASGISLTRRSWTERGVHELADRQVGPGPPGSE